MQSVCGTCGKYSEEEVQEQTANVTPGTSLTGNASSKQTTLLQNILTWTNSLSAELVPEALLNDEATQPRHFVWPPPNTCISFLRGWVYKTLELAPKPQV